MKKILVVEDNKQELQYCTNRLRILGTDIHVIEVQSAEEALSYLNHNKNTIDGAFIDIGLPGMDGFTLATKIRDMDKYHFLPIVFETAANCDSSETYKKYNNLDYLLKPYTDEAFDAAAKKMIREIDLLKKLFNKREREITFYIYDGCIRLPYSSILYAKIEHRKTTLVTRKKEYVLYPISLRQLIHEIGEETFVQCHKSFAVNVLNIRRIQNKTIKSWEIYFSDAANVTKCKLSQQYKNDVEDLLKKN